MKRNQRAIFLDRDGTINEDVGDLCSSEKLIFIPRSIDALRKLAPHFQLFIVTNQPGIGKKAFTETAYRSFTEHFIGILRREGVFIRDVYHCPHTRADGCLCRKPSPFFLRQAARDHGIDLESSCVVGDHPHDIDMAHAAGAGSVYVLTGHGMKHRDELSAVPGRVAEDLYDAAGWIIGRMGLHE